jgi:uncharacterized RmlC-like cupin family protein
MGRAKISRRGMAPTLANENAVNGLKLNRGAVTIATQAKTHTHTHHINLNWVVVVVMVGWGGFFFPFV